MRWLTSRWYSPSPVRWLFWPLSLLYRLVTVLRKWAYQRDWFIRHRLPVPVIVVGNISVGGTGKTPFVIWLAAQLQQAGYQPGIISRGYGGKANHYPLVVTAQTQPEQAGDEPVLIAQRSGCPVVVDPNRSQAAVHLLSHFSCDVIISDDGLQHYALQRDIEIVLVDAKRRFGNKLCLPAGPLREPMSRLNQVDFIVFNGADKTTTDSMQLQATEWVNLAYPSQRRPLEAFVGQEAHVVAAIGHPERFFDQLTDQGIIVHPHHFNDHHRYQKTDLNFYDDLPILMTEKDAVKCQPFAHNNMWYLPVTAKLPEHLATAILAKLRGLQHG